MQLSFSLDEYVVFDFETTGLSPWAGDEVVEIGAIKIFGNEVDEKRIFQTLVNPNRIISEEASRINGITNDMVADAPALKDAFLAFMDFVGNARLVAQNAKFDMGFVSKYLVQFQLRRDFDVYDTLNMSRRYFPNESTHNLDAICGRLGIQIDEKERHRSMGDVKITAQAFLKLREKFGEIHQFRQKFSA